MGAWGSGLYANDATCDVRDTYISFLEKGLRNIEAYAKTLEELEEYIADDEEPLLWYALAETQWKYGRLMPEVKEKALSWIDKKGGIEEWLESPNKGAGWLKTLEKLKAKLESPMPPEKKIRKPAKFEMNLWDLNDVYAYQFNKETSKENGMYGKYMLMQKIGEGTAYTGETKVTMRIHVFDKIFDELPSLDDVDGLRILPLDSPSRVTISRDYVMEGIPFIHKKKPIWMSGLITPARKSGYPKRYLTFIGNTPGPMNIRTNDREVDWEQIENWLNNFYSNWRGIEYDTVADGEYEYFGNNGDEP